MDDTPATPLCDQTKGVVLKRKQNGHTMVAKWSSVVANLVATRFVYVAATALKTSF